jgi:hypothetical protein
MSARGSRSAQKPEPDIQRSPPHSVEAEMGVLGSMIMSPSTAIAECVAKIRPEFFYVPAHQTIYNALVDLWDRREAIDLITFTEFLRGKNVLDAIGGAAFVTNLFTFVPCAAAVGHYLDIVTAKYILRESIAAGTEFVRRAHEPGADDEAMALLDEHDSRIASIRSLHGRNGADEGCSLIDYVEMDSAIIKAANLLGKRWLCRKGIALLIGATGVGKSSASIQAAVLWALEREAFGIKPAKRLKILFIQAENDDGDMHEMAKGVCDHFGFTKKKREIIRQSLTFVTERALSGQKFLALLRRLIRKHKPDIVWIDPLQAYAGGDLKEPSITTAFLRNGLNAILDETDCAAIVTHHSTKTIYHDTSQWTQTDWNYFGAGGAEIANVPRAILNIEHTDAAGVFKWHAGKRWDRIGWCDDKGNATAEHVYCWHKLGAIYWRDAAETDHLRIQSAKRKAKGGKTEDDLFNLVPPTGTIRKNSLFANAHRAEISRDNTRDFYQILIDDQRIFEWPIPRAKARPEIHVSRFPQPQPDLNLKVVK